MKLRSVMLDAEEQGGKPGLENSYCRLGLFSSSFYHQKRVKNLLKPENFFFFKKANFRVLRQNLWVLRPYLYLFPNPQVLWLRVWGWGLKVTESRVWVRELKKL